MEMELSNLEKALPQIQKRWSLLVVLVTLTSTFALVEFPFQFLGIIFAFLLLASTYNLPELGVGLFVNGLYLVGFFWRGFEITYLITPLALLICTIGLVHYVWNNGLSWRFGILPGIVLWIGLMLFWGISYSPLPDLGLVRAGKYLSMNLFIFFATMLFIGDLNKLKNLLKVIAFTGFALVCVSLIYLAVVGMGTMHRFTLPGQNTIWFARSLGLSLLATLSLLEFTKRRWHKLVFIVFILLMLFLMYITASRGPLFALLIVALLYFLILQKKKLTLWKGLSFILLIFFSFKLFISIAPGQIWNRILNLFSTFDLTTLLRLRALEAAKDLFLDYPLMGVGTGGFGHFNMLTYPHNIFLEMASELGILGILPLLVMVLYSAYLGIKLLNNKYGSDLELGLARGFFVIFIFALINSQVSGEIFGNYELWFSVAAIWTLHVTYKESLKK